VIDRQESTARPASRTASDTDQLVLEDRLSVSEKDRRTEHVRRTDVLGGLIYELRLVA
jgi:hypothetical protein